ncbi:unnamed protein product [Rhizoctonia solani]|uniref:Uncharacterized protein n=1 Tax=Rhizoctonia solani TaxID=456999 RepID=A0A8H7I1V3_9AGAM|nr:hypothetical protein RHS01_11247 [Rhizoctonia solani]KAF8747814.1 hypothetical protein RHS01_11246 [Rhizoctonia solani]KAF8756564.1 hypothetical protein RHS01_04598 [Rhizoctonia solani]KAF8756565.1 hypothetical protein RHS01_04599 [Rhizoctonia solani]CAE6380183.1 unnamed protein product [Rhizoctonia solani]
MTIRPGVYNINNCHNNYAMMMYGNEEDGTPLTCIDGTNSQTQFNIKETGPGTNRYTIGSDRFRYNVGADSKNLDGNPHPFTTLDQFEWSIEPAGPELYKVHIPNMDAYWFLPDGHSQTHINIEKSQGRPAEVWRMVWVEDN